MPVRLNYAKDVLKQTFNLWNRTIHLWTVTLDGKEIVCLTYDGTEIQENNYSFDNLEIPKDFNPVKPVNGALIH